ncbi:MAG: sigma 54-interacting transcriptional regulator [Lachnospiraceae bacterium]|nr:sigma 54-interacting transcriptional regulator [Lachnospiraceae bacterium]
MKKKKISIISLDPRAGASYAGEVESLFGEYADISMFNVMDGSAMGKLERADLFVVSTDAYGSAEEVARHVPMDCQTMAVEVSFRWAELRKLKEIPTGSKVLFVNMTQTMAREAIAQLNQFGINHIQMIPFYPGAVLEEEVSIAVTPDEMRYVPESIETKINLGQRPCTSGMMIEIALRLGLEKLLETEKFQSYFQAIATSNYSFDQMFSRSIRLESQFHILMGILDDGIIGVNEKGEIFACNKRAEEITKVSASLIIGRRCDEVFSYLPFLTCLMEKKPVPAKINRINGINVSVEVVPVLRQGECIGAFARLQKFNEVEVRQNELRSQLLQKGHVAKYSFDDVIGESDAILRTKEVLKRMAASESPVLLIGETGTGKELFAHAVHRASRRKDGPFIAINVAAVPENLLESELFGYEEGAFTGAKKGGRPGLFEFSHKGTLFLDEVEGMSQALQIKLLRVLQEREIMRVGGNRVISIDVRIVAATNESLEQKVEEGSFRRDLYYRLNTLPIVIPPLAERGEDMFRIIDRFREELGGSFDLTEPVKEFLRNYSWPGNIRELRNVVEYFIYTGHEHITMEDLPPTVFRKHGAGLRPVTAPLMDREAGAVRNAGKDTVPGNDRVKTSAEDKAPAWKKPAAESQGSQITGKEDAFWFVLEQLYLASEEQTSIGRERILMKARECHIPISQQEVRNILTELASRGLARVGRGRGGSRLMPAGRQLWESRPLT